MFKSLWPTHACTIHPHRSSIQNLLLHNIDAILYNFDTDIYGIYPGSCKDMTKKLVRLTLLLVGANDCTPCIINWVWGKDDEAQLALGGPCRDLSLILHLLLTLSKVAINTIHASISKLITHVLVPMSDSFQCLPPTLQQLLLHLHQKLVFVPKPVPQGTKSISLLMQIWATTSEALIRVGLNWI